MSEAEKLAEKIRREEGKEVVIIREQTENRENEVADRVATILNRLDDLRQPFRKRREERRLKRKEAVSGFFEGVRKSRSGERQNEESLKEENERLKRQLKNEKEEQEDSDSFAGRGVRSTKNGRDIAIEL